MIGLLADTVTLLMASVIVGHYGGEAAVALAMTTRQERERRPALYAWGGVAVMTGWIGWCAWIVVQAFL